MANFTTGPSLLPDVGTLSYNGCTFSSLFETSVSGTVVKDSAGRTTKLVDYIITADGFVTLSAGAPDVQLTVQQMSNLLSAQGGALKYNGRGIQLDVSTNDVAWGPSTELHEFQPLGGGLSAKCKITIRTRIFQGQKAVANNRLRTTGVLQFNQEVNVSYGEDGFSSLSIKGTLEVALTRSAQNVYTLTTTVDDYRQTYMDEILKSIDLRVFRVTKRNFSISRDRRTMEWDFQAEERPYMDPPPDCTLANGSYNVRPAKQGMGLCTWLCTLSATYTLKNTSARRTAWLVFLALLRTRMMASSLSTLPAALGAQPPGPIQNAAIQILRNARQAAFGPGGNVLADGIATLNAQRRAVSNGRRAFLVDFNFTEGLYLDSKKITFGATWKLVTTFQGILLASGLWKKAQERNQNGGNLWAISMQSTSGPFSWLQNRIDPAQDVIVDFGNQGV